MDKEKKKDIQNRGVNNLLVVLVLCTLTKRCFITLMELIKELSIQKVQFF